MALIVDALIEPVLGYSLVDAHPSMESVRHVPESELAGHARSVKPVVLPGPKQPKGYAGFVKAAQTFGTLARQEREARLHQPVVAVLFRDSDGTQRAPRDHWERVVQAMSNGFERTGFADGVPMVPRPKSEAWLLCALKTAPYQDCAALEEAPGNDNSPNNLKDRLAAAVGGTPSAEGQADWVRQGKVDPDQIDMPSFAEFKASLKAALRTVGLRPE